MSAVPELNSLLKQ